MTLELGPAEVHVWLVATDVRLRGRLPRVHEDSLPPEERGRLERYLIDGKKNEYLVGKLLTRRVLSRYDPRPPAAWAFVAAPRGKPRVADRTCRLRFNLSHTTGLIALAVARCEVGLDVEGLAEREPGLPRRFFAPSEADWVDAADPRPGCASGPSPRAHRFGRLWTLKEAFLKVCGDGLHRPLDSFEFGAEDPPVIRFLGGRPDDPCRYWFHHGEPIDGFAMAVGLRTRRRPVRLQVHTLDVDGVLSSRVLEGCSPHSPGS